MIFAQVSGWNRATALFEQRKWYEAKQAFNEVERTNPGKTDALVYQGKCLINLGHFVTAEAALQAYKTTHPQSGEAMYLLGYVFFRQGNSKASLDAYTLAERLQDPLAEDFVIMALDYRNLSEYTAAEHYLKMAVRIEPNNAQAHYHLGRVLYEQSRFDQAIAEFQRVMQLDPRNADAPDNLGQSFEAKHDVEHAIEAYRKAIDLDSVYPLHNQYVYVNLANLLLQRSQPEEAIPLLVTASKLDATSSKLHYLLSKAFLDLNHVAEAERESEASIKLDANNPATHYLLGRICWKEGKVEIARREFALTESLIRGRRTNSTGAGNESMNKP